MHSLDTALMSSANLDLVRSVRADMDRGDLGSAEVDQPTPQTDMEGT
jgi:hypothetical protein